MGSPRAQIEVTASSNRLTSGLAAARSKVMKWAGAVGRTIKGISGNSTVGNVVGNLAGKGMDYLASQAGEVMDFEKAITRFGIAANQTPEKLAAMRKQIAEVSAETAIGRDQIMSAAQTYVDLTGDAAGASTAMRTFARISQASGSSMDDVATAAASMQMSMKLDASQIEAVFSGLIAQGKMGAVSLKDMAGELSTLGPAMAKFKGGTGADGIRAMGAAFQVVRQGAGSAAEANTQLQSVITGVISHAKKFEKAGVKIYDKDPKTGVKTLRSFASIIDSISKSKLMANPTALGDAFGRTEALAAFNTLSKNKALFDELLVAGQDNTAVQKDLATYMESSAGKMDKAFNGLKLAVAEALTPERIDSFVAALTKVVDALVKIIGYVEKLTESMDFGSGVNNEIRTNSKNAELIKGKGQKLTDEQWMQRSAQLMKSGQEKLKSDNAQMRSIGQGQIDAANIIRKTGGDKWAGDASGSVNSPAAEAAIASIVKAVTTANPEDASKLAADSTLGMILGELKKLNATGIGGPTEIKADGNQIAKTVNNSTDQRRTP